MSRDTTEGDLKQRRELSAGNSLFFDSAPVRAAVHGRLLVLDGACARRYRWAGHAFGFSSHPELWLWAADAGIKQHGAEERSDDRLSWNLDTLSTGGWRAGRVTDLGSSRVWEKRLYYRE